jgi:hypothetical protein
MMLEELQCRNYSAITTRNYLRVVADFAKYFGKSPDKLGPNELRTLSRLMDLLILATIIFYLCLHRSDAATFLDSYE